MDVDKQGNQFFMAWLKPIRKQSAADIQSIIALRASCFLKVVILRDIEHKRVSFMIINTSLIPAVINMSLQRGESIKKRTMLRGFFHEVIYRKHKHQQYRKLIKELKFLLATNARTYGKHSAVNVFGKHIPRRLLSWSLPFLGNSIKAVNE